ncbi:MAG: AI-2E family transporter, partial [Planctomycetia bacterium]|nr:AI-2E family transporter [Planctomycetia bacterium]
RRAVDAGVILLAVLGFGAAFTWLGPVLKPFLVAVFLFYVARFGAKTLSRIGLGPRTAYMGLLGIVVALAVLFGQLVSREAATFVGKWPGYEKKIARAINALPQLDRLLPDHTERARAAPGAVPPPAAPEGGGPAPDPASAGTVLGDLFGRVSKSLLDYVLRHTLEVAEIFALVLVYLIFLFIGSQKLPDRIRRAFPGGQGERILLIGEGILHSMERFMAVKTVVGLGMGATAGLLMYFFKLDHWLLWVALFFASNYITYIGSIVACVPPILIAFLDMPGLTAAIVLSALLVANRILWIDFVEIRMSGKELNLDPTLMFLWLAYWGWAWGVLGLLLAYPMMAAVKIVLAHMKGGEGWAVLLSEE